MNSSAEVYPIIVNYPADDPLLESFLGSPITKDWTLKDHGNNEAKGQFSPKGYAGLLCAVAARTDWDGESFEANIHFPKDDCSGISVADGTINLYSYTSVLLSEIDMLLDTRGLRNKDVVIGLNLLNYDVSDKHIDQISSAIHGHLRGNPALNKRGNALVFMLRSLEEIAPEDIDDVPKLFGGFVKWPNRQLEIRAFGYEERKDYQIEQIKASGFLTRTRIESKYMLEALNPSRESVAEELIFRTNMQIGHFVLTNSHIRTHYSIGEFIQRDFVKEFFFHELSDLVKNNVKDKQKETVCLVVVGVDEGALMDIASSFKSMNTKVNCVLSCKNIDNDKSIAKIRNSKAVLVLTDIVNTGNAINACVGQIRGICGDHAKALMLYSIARMENTPDRVGGLSLESLVTVKRPFYAAETCPLCKVEQPVPGHSGSVVSAEGFIHSSHQLTPFDFWEIVGERDALFFSCEGEDVKVRVSTTESKTKKYGLINRYQKWFMGLVRDKLAAIGVVSGEIDLIVTVDEPSGRQFSEIVAKALNLSSKNIDCVPRGYHGTIQVNEGSKPRVLLVDDGINTGSTFKELKKYCESKCEIVAGIVLDNRLNDGELEDVRYNCGLEEKTVVALYHWRSDEKEAVGILSKMIELWDDKVFSFHPIGAMLDYHWRKNMRLEHIFNLNRRLYDDAFMNEKYLSPSERILFVRAMAPTEEDIARLSRRVIKKSYPELAKIAEMIAAEKHGEDINQKTDLAQHCKSDHSISKIEQNHVPTDPPKPLERYAAPIVVSTEIEKPVATGFLYRVPIPSEDTDSALLLITCAHVVKKLKDIPLEVLIDSKYYTVSLLYVGEDKTSRDVALMKVDALNDFEFAVSDVGPMPLDPKRVFRSYGYRSDRGISIARYGPLKTPRSGGQAGTVVVENNGEFPVDRGASGSPVFDEDGRLVGLISHKTEGSAKQEVSVQPFEAIQKVIDEWNQANQKQRGGQLNVC